MTKNMGTPKKRKEDMVMTREMGLVIIMLSLLTRGIPLYANKLVLRPPSSPAARGARKRVRA